MNSPRERACLWQILAQISCVCHKTVSIGGTHSYAQLQLLHCHTYLPNSNITHTNTTVRQQRMLMRIPAELFIFLSESHRHIHRRTGIHQAHSFSCYGAIVSYCVQTHTEVYSELQSASGHYNSHFEATITSISASFN